MRLAEINSNQKEQWNRFVASAANPSFAQSFQWGTVKSGTWKPFYLAVCDDEGVMLATALLLKRRLPYTGQSVLYCPRGPVFKRYDNTLIHYFFTALTEFAKTHRAILLKCDPEIPESSESVLQQLSDSGLRYNPENIQPRATIILNIESSEEALLKSFHHKTRYNIRLAEKKGIEVRMQNTAAGVDVFYDLFRTTAERDRFLILQKSYFHHLWQTLYPEGLCALFTAHYEDRPLAAVFQIIFGGTMTYLYGASSNEWRHLMPNHLIHWRAIQWAKTMHLKRYDLWGIPSRPHEGHPMWGVYRFKKGFCDEETRWIGMYEAVYKPVWNRLFTAGARAFKKTARFIRTGSLRTPLEE